MVGSQVDPILCLHGKGGFRSLGTKGLGKGIEQVVQELGVTLKSESTSLMLGLGRGSCF